MNILNKEICRFINESSPEYFEAEYNLKDVQNYINYLWMCLKPKGRILNMGIMKKTPSNLLWPVMSESVTKITYVELDNKRKIKTSAKEGVVWEIDFYKFLKYQIKNDHKFNGVVIWHGPEHMTKKRGIKTIKSAFEVATDYVIVACPWDRLEGWKNQPKGKDHLGHKSVWTQDDFLELGMRVMSSGERGVHPGHLIAWKML